MAPRRNKRPNSRTIAADEAVIAAIKELPDYAPRNTACSLVALLAADEAVNSANERVSSLERALDQARFAYDLATEVRHGLALDAKVEVVAQYGRDSAEVQAVGLTPLSTRRRPTRRADAEG